MLKKILYIILLNNAMGELYSFNCNNTYNGIIEIYISNDTILQIFNNEFNLYDNYINIMMNKLNYITQNQFNLTFKYNVNTISYDCYNLGLVDNLKKFKQIINNTNQTISVLLTDCNNGGVAYVNTLSSYYKHRTSVVGIISNNTDDVNNIWLFGHEVGHTLGLYHLHDDGGLMSYNSPYYKNEVQYNNIVENNVCNNLNNSIYVI